jgi:hypothetical protein
MGALDLSTTDAAIHAADAWAGVAEWLRDPTPRVTAVDSHAHVFVQRWIGMFGI